MEDQKKKDGDCIDIIKRRDEDVLLRWAAEKERGRRKRG